MEQQGRAEGVDVLFGSVSITVLPQRGRPGKSPTPEAIRMTPTWTRLDQSAEFAQMADEMVLDIRLT